VPRSATQTLKLNLSGTYIEPFGLASYQTGPVAGGWPGILRQMLYMESQYEPARYAGATERLGARDPITTSSADDHLSRGDDITGGSASVLSTDFRLYADGVDLTGGENPGCVGTYTCQIDLPQNAGSFGAWMDNAGFFVATGSTVRINGRDRTARMVVAAGKPAGDRPDTGGTWQGSTVEPPRKASTGTTSSGARPA